MANINITVDGHTCTPPELISVSDGFSGGTETVTFRITYDSILDWYKQYVDPDATLAIEYNYQDGSGWLGILLDQESVADFPINIEKRIGFTTVQFRLALKTNSECGIMYSNVLTNVYT